MVLILRLLIDLPHGHLVHGELLEADGTSLGRFVDWPRLQELLVARVDAGDQR